jgi:hypothetical protein
LKPSHVITIIIFAILNIAWITITFWENDKKYYSREEHPQEERKKNLV